MRYNKALITKLSLVFILTLVLLVFVFYSFSTIQKEHMHEKVFQHYSHLSNHFAKNSFKKEQVIDYLQDLDFIVINTPHKILKGDHLLLKKKGFEVLLVDNSYYFHIITPHFHILCKDTNNKLESDPMYLIIFIFIVMLFIIIFLLILKNIKDNTLLLHSKQLFLRTVMHELKTPLGKGRIISELLEDTKQKARLINIFEKLTFLIDDFSKVEQILSNNYTAYFRKYTLEEIIARSIDILLLEDKDQKVIKNCVCEKTLKVDIDILSLAIKNLLDNGIKYSTDHKVFIEYEEEHLHIISKGEQLSRPLDEYLKPFHNETKDKTHGMGMGLYIVHTILSLHNFTLTYTYKDGKNIFSILY